MTAVPRTRPKLSCRIPPWSSPPPQCRHQRLASSLSVWLGTKRCVTKGARNTETTAALRGQTLPLHPLHLVIGGLNVKYKVGFFLLLLLLVNFCYCASVAKCPVRRVSEGFDVLHLSVFAHSRFAQSIAAVGRSCLADFC